MSQTSETSETAAPEAAGFVPPREPIYDWGMRVTAAADLFNDGSHPHAAPGALLVPKGTPGEVARVGRTEDGNIPVYAVEFPGGVLVGCFEEELTPLGNTLRPKPGVLG
ncbi:nitrogen fixation protein NifZ [Azospirillum sp.]|uniref:nitrogen fixation protein NifZ n=1 Tax=Azospirillum sp. TaxID=34012 RepID=UPI002D5807FB|nr:nitrogen fixation protein NifZ [Azospirillum sp.]HYD64371.1 nitrogen fixation protein NifZ [Azospirillum sp.]